MKDLVLRPRNATQWLDVQVLLRIYILREVDSSPVCLYCSASQSKQLLDRRSVTDDGTYRTDSWTAGAVRKGSVTVDLRGWLITLCNPEWFRTCHSIEIEEQNEKSCSQKFFIEFRGAHWCWCGSLFRIIDLLLHPDKDWPSLDEMLPWISFTATTTWFEKHLTPFRQTAEFRTETTATNAGN